MRQVDHMLQVAAYQMLKVYLRLLAHDGLAAGVGVCAGEGAFLAVFVVEGEYIAELAVLAGITPAAERV